jgi:hypothetical protein
LVGWFCLVRPGSPRSPAVIARQKIDRVFDRVPPSSTGARARRTAPSSWSRSPPGSRAASPPILAGGSQRWRTVPPADRDSCLAGGSASVQVESVCGAACSSYDGDASVVAPPRTPDRSQRSVVAFSPQLSPGPVLNRRDATRRDGCLVCEVAAKLGFRSGFRERAHIRGGRTRTDAYVTSYSLRPLMLAFLGFKILLTI